jgi:hypothetical protein
VRVQSGPQGPAEQVEDSRCRLAPDRQPPTHRAPSDNPRHDRPRGRDKHRDNDQARNSQGDGDSEKQDRTDPSGQPPQQPGSPNPSHRAA